MLDPLDFENRPFLDALSKKRRRTALVLTLENITLHFWRLFFWVLLFCGLWMLDIPAFFGAIITIPTTLCFFAGLIYLIQKDVLSFAFPKQKTIDKALEARSNFPQGHISILDDTLANPKTHETRNLWNAAQKRILHSLQTLKAPHRRAILSRQDPSALRFIAVLVFLSGLMVSGTQWQNKITNGLFPINPSYVISQGKSTNLWIKPPLYTGIGQTHLIGHGTYNGVLDIPEGSEIRIRMHSLFGKYIQPSLQHGKTITQMEYLGSGLYGIETTIENGNKLSIKQAYIPRASWRYNYIIDTPPKIQSHMPKAKIEQTEEAERETTDALTQEEPKGTPQPYEFLSNDQIRFPLIVNDDYGVKDLHMRMNIDDMVEDRPLGMPAEEIRLVMSQANTDFKISPVFDMTWHTWAGLPVTFEYTVTDHKGQNARLENIYLILPEREFEHPMAKSLIAMRKRLAWDYKDSFIDIALNLKTLLNAPAYFQNNPVIYLAIKTASMRLILVNNKNEDIRLKAAHEIIKLLWNAALVVEDGNLSLAMRELREAQSTLENAMRDPNASEDEISRLMDNLREKMANYFAEMQRDMQKRMANGEKFPEMPEDYFSQIISPDTLSRLMEEIETALRDGNEQKAQELMSKLQRMMEMMDGTMSPQLPADMQAMRDGINELQELIERQRKLLNQTQKQARIKRLLDGRKSTPPSSVPSIDEMFKDFGLEGAPPAPDQPPTTPDSTNKLAVNTLPNKTEQEALRYILGQLMLDAAEKLDEIPETMGLAEQEMRGSENALEKNNPRTSIPHQEKAIAYLKDSQEQLSQQLRLRMKQMIGIGMSGGRQKYDPLGRPYGGEEEADGTPNDSHVKVPDAMQKKRVDEILKTLRDRSGDLGRPDDELDYFRRLLRQF